MLPRVAQVSEINGIGEDQELDRAVLFDEFDRRHARSQQIRGPRVLLTGVSDAAACELARSLADRGCRLVVQAPAMTSQVDRTIERLRATGRLVGSHVGPIEGAAQAMQFTADAAAAAGSLDLAVNFVSIDLADVVDALQDADTLEDRLWELFETVVSASHVAANRMGLTWRDGLILNVVSSSGEARVDGHLLHSLLCTPLAVVTRRLSERWAHQSVRINAVAPLASRLDEIAGCRALQTIVDELRSGRATGLTGLVFDLEMASAAC